MICCGGVWEKWDPSALSVKLQTWSQTYGLPELYNKTSIVEIAIKLVYLSVRKFSVICFSEIDSEVHALLDINIIIFILFMIENEHRNSGKLVNM